MIAKKIWSTVPCRFQERRLGPRLPHAGTIDNAGSRKYALGSEPIWTPHLVLPRPFSSFPSARFRLVNVPTKTHRGPT